MTMDKILVVDDEPAIVTLLSYNLKQAGYEVVTATDGCLLYTSPSPRDTR